MQFNACSFSDSSMEECVRKHMHRQNYKENIWWKKQFIVNLKMWQWVCAESSVYYSALQMSSACLESSALAWCLLAVWARMHKTKKASVLWPVLLLSRCYENYCIRSSQLVCYEAIKRRLNHGLALSVECYLSWKCHWQQNSLDFWSPAVKPQTNIKQLL